MAKRKRTNDSEESLDSAREEDATFPNAGESELMAAVDQHDAEMRGEANDPPSSKPQQEPKAEEKPETKEAEAPEDDGRPKVELRVFIASGGIRWDQMAGFKSYAKRNKMGPRSIPEWRKALDAFMKRPV